MMNDLEKLVEEARARFDAVADEAGEAAPGRRAGCECCRC